MAREDLQQPNIGTPDFARGASTTDRKIWAIVTTVAFALFWIYGLFLVAGLFSGAGVHWSGPLLCALGLAVGIYGRRKVEAR